MVGLPRADTGNLIATCQASAITDGIRLTRDEAGIAHLFFVVAFFGGEWAVIRELNNTTAVDNTVDKAHTLSGEPNLGFFSMNEMNAYGNGQATMQRCFGMFTNVSDTIVQRAMAMFATGNPTLLGAQVRTDRVAMSMDAAGAVDTAVEITAIDATNVTFTVRDSGTTADTWGGLVGLIDETVELVTQDSPDNASAVWNVNAASETPQAVIGMMNNITAVDTAKANDEGNPFAIYAVDDLGNEYSASWYSEDGAGSGGSPSLTIERDSLNANMVAMTDVADTEDYEWQNLTFTSDGFDVSDANNITNNGCSI